jgi:hypothetical protein
MSTSQRWYVFWGTVLILLAMCFFLKALGVIDDVLGYFWPGFLLLAGIWLLVGARVRTEQVPDEATVTVDLQGARQASVEIEHGAGLMEVTGGAPPGAALTINRGAGLKVSSRMEGDRLVVQLECGPSFVPVLGPESGLWRLCLTDQVPLALNVESGASQMTLDLRDVPVTYCKLEAGASSITLIPPARVANALLDVEVGAAMLNVQIPEGVAARIRFKDGLSAHNIDQERFPRLEEGIYQSADYDSAAYRVELHLESGVSSVTVR